MTRDLSAFPALALLESRLGPALVAAVRWPRGAHAGGYISDLRQLGGDNMLLSKKTLQSATRRSPRRCGGMLRAHRTQ